MRKLENGYIINIILTLITFIGFCITIKIDNLSRAPQNINTDYYMNSLPYIYLILISLVFTIIFNLYKIIRTKHKVK